MKAATAASLPTATQKKNTERRLLLHLYPQRHALQLRLERVQLGDGVAVADQRLGHHLDRVLFVVVVGRNGGWLLVLGAAEANKGAHGAPRAFILR